MFQQYLLAIVPTLTCVIPVKHVQNLERFKKNLESVHFI